MQVIIISNIYFMGRFALVVWQRAGIRHSVPSSGDEFILRSFKTEEENRKIREKNPLFGKRYETETAGTAA